MFISNVWLMEVNIYWLIFGEDDGLRKKNMPGKRASSILLKRIGDVQISKKEFSIFIRSIQTKIFC